MIYPKPQVFTSLRLLPAVVAVMMLLPLLQGCGGGSRIHRDLLHAENIMEEHPDSAYDILSALQPDSGDSEEDRALHALLLTQSMHKTHRLKYGCEQNTLQSADSLMHLAMTYYERHNDRKRQMLAYHYTGVVISLDSVNFTSALIPLSRSIELSNADNLSIWTARSYDVMGDIFYFGGAYHDMTEALKQALIYFKKAGDKELILQTQLGIATGYLNESEYEKAILLSDSIMQLKSVQDDSPTWSDAAHVKAIASYFNGDYEETLSLIKRFDSLGFHQQDLVVFEVAGRIHLGDIEEARKIELQYKSELTEDDRNIIRNAFAIVTNDSPRHLATMTVMYDSLTALYDKNGRQDFNTIQRAINLETNRRYNEEMNSRTKRVGLFISIFIVIVILLAVFSYIRMRSKNRHVSKCHEDAIKSREEKLENAQDFINQLERSIKQLEHKQDKDKLEISRQKKELTKVKSQLGFDTLKLLRIKKENLNNIIRQFYSFGEDDEKAGKTEKSNKSNKSEIAEKEYLKLIRKEVKSYTPTVAHMIRMESQVNEDFSNIIMELKKDFPNFKKEYYHVIIYFLLGFDIYSIAYLMKLPNVKAVSNILYQVRTYIRKSEGRIDLTKYAYLLNT